MPVEQQLRDLRRALQRLAAAVMWRDGVPMPQVVKDTLETMENTPKERISECTPEQFFDGFQDASSGGRRILSTPEVKSQRAVQILLTTHRIVAISGTSSIRLSPTTERNGQLRFLNVCRMTVPRRISRKGKAVSRLPVLRWKCSLLTRSASRSVRRSSMCQCLSILLLECNQVTKHAEFPQIYYIDKLVDMLVVMQRMVPRIQTGLTTVEIPINQVTKHAEFPQTLYIDNVVVEMPVVMQRKVPQIRTVLKTVEIRRRSSSAELWRRL